MTEPASRELLVRGAGLYLPLAAMILATWWRRPTRAVTAGAILAAAWALPTILLLNVVAQRVGWWSFHASSATVAAVPADLLIGWVILWGPLPAIAAGGRRTTRFAAPALVTFDLLVMPRMGPVVQLGRPWLVGEVVAAAICLAPALALAGWTALGRHLAWRAALQIAAFAGLTFYVIPEVTFAFTGGGFGALAHRAHWQLLLAGVVAAVPAAMAVQAVREFAVVGGGTPLPLDPPCRLVTTGPYAYVANPMQLGATLLLVVWGALLGSAGVTAAGAMAAIFSSGLARWSERGDLPRRFGRAWHEYRAEVHDWRPRWRPHPTGTATLDVAGTCEPCTEVGSFFFLRRDPVALERRVAEHLDTPPTRITYTNGDTTDVGIGAVARALEHLSLAWAAAGWILRFPGLRWLFQLVADAVGAGPVALVDHRDERLRPPRNVT